MKVVAQAYETIQPMMELKKLVCNTHFKIKLRNENLSLHNFVEDESSGDDSNNRSQSDDSLLPEDDIKRLFSKFNGDSRRYF